jgi:hypothetical protein
MADLQKWMTSSNLHHDSDSSANSIYSSSGVSLHPNYNYDAENTHKKATATMFRSDQALLAEIERRIHRDPWFAAEILRMLSTANPSLENSDDVNLCVTLETSDSDS